MAFKKDMDQKRDYAVKEAKECTERVDHSLLQKRTEAQKKEEEEELARLHAYNLRVDAFMKRVIEAIDQRIQKLDEDMAALRPFIKIPLDES